MHFFRHGHWSGNVVVIMFSKILKKLLNRKYTKGRTFINNTKLSPNSNQIYFQKKKKISKDNAFSKPMGNMGLSKVLGL